MSELDFLTGKQIINLIYSFKGVQVMVDRDLAQIYKVETRVLNQAVKRNSERFPAEFMFQLDQEDFELWRSQSMISNSDKMGPRRAPYVFTEHIGASLKDFGKKWFAFSKMEHGLNHLINLLKIQGNG